LRTDQLAKDVNGPWTEAGRTQLFETAPPGQALATKTPQLPTVAPDGPQQLPAVVDQPRPESKIAVASRAGRLFIVATGRGAIAAGAKLSGVLSERAKRRHEIKLAKIQADAIAKANQSSPSPMQSTGQGPITFAPQIVQTTIIKNVNRAGGCGCSGCGVVLILALLALIGFIIYQASLRTPLH
jgi:hypothetical protein